jgi:hypothetical protein
MKGKTFDKLMKRINNMKEEIVSLKNDLIKQKCTCLNPKDNVLSIAIEGFTFGLEWLSDHGYPGHANEAALLLGATRKKEAMNVLLNAYKNPKYKMATESIAKALRIYFLDNKEQWEKELEMLK